MSSFTDDARDSLLASELADQSDPDKAPAVASGFGAGGLQVVLLPFDETDDAVLPAELRLQCPPLDEFTQSQTFEFNDFLTVSRGQFSRRAGADLASFAFTTLSVDYGGRPWTLVPGASSPPAVGRQLQAITRAGTPLILSCSSVAWSRPDVYCTVTLRSVTVSERAGEPDARYFDLQFVEWRRQEVGQLGLGRKPHRHKLPASVRLEGSKAIVEGSGESIGSVTDPVDLHDLSKHFYGTTTYHWVIAKANGVGAFPPGRDLAELPRPGGRRTSKLKIPRLPHAGTTDPATGGTVGPR